MNYKEETHNLQHSFYLLDTVLLAKALLGKRIRKHLESGDYLEGIIVETEAYLSKNDAASHSASGKSKRNEQMFEKAGTIYVYKIYGLHHCFNIVSNAVGIGEAVLIRAVEPTNRIDHMKQNRKQINERNLCNGPAKFCQAFGITPNDNDKHLKNCEFQLLEGSIIQENEIVCTTRIGISKDKDLPYRFYLKNNPFVSKK